MTLAQRVREHRYAKGWGPDELASRASISRTALYQIESGKTEQPRAGTLRRIAQALEVPTEVLYGRGPSAHPPARTASEALPALYPPAEAGPSLDRELDRKFREVLASPLGEGVARIVEETHRIMPRSMVGVGW